MIPPGLYLGVSVLLGTLVIGLLLTRAKADYEDGRAVDVFLDIASTSICAFWMAHVALGVLA